MATPADTKHYDCLVLGSGEAGKFIPIVLSSKHGKRCAIVERQWYGGACPNMACIPSKNIIHSAKVHHAANDGQFSDMKGVKQKRIVVTKGMHDLFDDVFKTMNIDFIWGEGKFTGPRTIQVTDKDGNKKTLSADIIIINTGSTALVDDIPGLREAEPMTHIEMLDIDHLPEHLVILGGGYIGLEFAQAMRRFGSKVTVLDHGGRILKHEDADVAGELLVLLEKEGITFHTSTTITQVDGKSGGGVSLKGTQGDRPFEVTGSHILCATGRVPNNKNIGLHLAGVELTNKGFIKVDENNKSTTNGIFGVGDCAGSPHFTHVSLDDFRIVIEHLFGKKQYENRRSDRQIPFTLFTDPELAHVGLREHEAKAKGVAYRLAKVPMAAFLRTRTLGQTDGFAKALISTKDDTILGFTALGVGAGELLPVVQLAMAQKLPYTVIQNLIITHPTLNEGLIALFDEVPIRS